VINTNVFSGIEVPKVLKEEQLMICLENYKNGDMEAKQLLIEHNIRLVLYISRKYLRNCESSNIDFEDLVMTGIEGLIKGINTYRFDKGVKLSVYITKCINNEILMYLKKNKRYENVVHFEEIINVDFDGNELTWEDVCQDDTCNYLEYFIRNMEYIRIREIIEDLDDSDKEFVKLYFGFYDRIYNQKEIAEIMGISQSYTSRKIKRLSMKLKKKLIREDICY